MAMKIMFPLSTMIGNLSINYTSLLLCHKAFNWLPTVDCNQAVMLYMTCSGFLAQVQWPQFIACQYLPRMTQCQEKVINAPPENLKNMLISSLLISTLPLCKFGFIVLHVQLPANAWLHVGTNYQETINQYTSKTVILKKY